MRDDDARRQGLAELHERRKQVIRLHKKQYGVMQIVELTGLSWPAVRTAIDLYEAGGAAALKPKERGRKSGEGRKLSAEQEAHIQKLIVEKRPEQLKMEFALWTRAAVGQLIEREFKIALSVRGVGKYLKRWGFTPQKPIRRAYERSPEAVKAWLEKDYPAIAERAKAEGGEIHWGDETALTNAWRWTQLRSERRNTRRFGARNPAEAVDDLDRDQSRQGALDDHRWRLQRGPVD